MQRLRELARLVETVYLELEDTYGGYQRSSGLTCSPGCGACCNNPQVEASPLEMLPLALDIYDRGQAESVLDSLRLHSGFSCIHFTRHSLDGRQGECGIYPLRPSLCRMFGAAGVSGRDGNVRLSVCRTIKEERAGHYRQALLASDSTPPRMADGKERVRQLDYALGGRDQPINEALATALEKVLMASCYSEDEHTDRVA